MNTSFDPTASPKKLLENEFELRVKLIMRMHMAVEVAVKGKELKVDTGRSISNE